MTELIIRVAQPHEYDAIGELTVAAYRGDGQTHPGHVYEEELRKVADRALAGEVLVAVDAATGALLGSVTFVVAGSPYAELSRDGEAEFRMLAVAPAAQGRHVGEALARECLRRARAAGCTAVVICMRDFVAAAPRLYARMGFVRAPELDWTVLDGINLLGLRYDLVER